VSLIWIFEFCANHPQCDHNSPCSSCIERKAGQDDLPSDICRGRTIAEHPQGSPLVVSGHTSQCVESDGRESPEDESLVKRSLRSAQKRSRTTETDAAHRRNSHLPEAPPMLEDHVLPKVSPDRPGRSRFSDSSVRDVVDVPLEQWNGEKPIEIIDALDPSDKDIVDILLEQWTVPVY
jgi:hypothetical protein